MKKTTIITLCASIICMLFFARCNKEITTEQSRISSEAQSVAIKSNSHGIVIPIGKKDGKGGCNSGWGFCRPKIKPVDFPTTFPFVFAIPEMSGNKMVWHVNYNHAEKEEVEFITDNLKNNTDSILLSYGLAFLSKDILSVFGVEYPVGVPSQYGSISNVNIKDCQFDVTFLWEHISDENIMNYEDQYED